VVVTDLRDQDGNKSSGNGDQDYNSMGVDGKNSLALPSDLLSDEEKKNQSNVELQESMAGSPENPRFHPNNSNTALLICKGLSNP